jgi:hypothetical protein
VSAAGARLHRDTLAVQIGDVSLGASGCDRRASYVPTETTCTPDTFEVHAKDVCRAVIANVASKNP